MRWPNSLGATPTRTPGWRDVDNEWENRAMYSRAGAAVGCVRVAVPPRPAVAAYSGYRRGRRLRAGRSAATVDGGCRHLPTRSPTYKSYRTTTPAHEALNPTPSGRSPRGAKFYAFGAGPRSSPKLTPAHEALNPTPLGRSPRGAKSYAFGAEPRSSPKLALAQ